MILTGKAKEDFERWYITYLRQREDIGDRYFDDSLLRFFWDGGDIMVNAFIVSWFDSVGIYLTIGRYGYILNNNEIRITRKSGNTRHEATKQAILKANKIYNEDSEL